MVPDLLKLAFGAGDGDWETMSSSQSSLNLVECVSDRGGWENAGISEELYHVSMLSSFKG